MSLVESRNEVPNLFVFAMSRERVNQALCDIARLPQNHEPLDLTTLNDDISLNPAAQRGPRRDAWCALKGRVVDIVLGVYGITLTEEHKAKLIGGVTFPNYEPGDTSHSDEGYIDDRLPRNLDPFQSELRTLGVRVSFDGHYDLATKIRLAGHIIEGLQSRIDPVADKQIELARMQRGLYLERYRKIRGALGVVEGWTVLTEDEYKTMIQDSLTLSK